MSFRLFQVLPAVLLMPEPKNIRFGGGVSDSVVNPVVLGVVVIAGLLVCFASRRKALAAFSGGGYSYPRGPSSGNRRRALSR